MPQTYDKLRSATLHWLKTYTGRMISSRQGGDLVMSLVSRGLPIDNDDQITLLTIIHELFLERIIVPGTPDTTSQTYFPNFTITPYGKKVLAQAGYQPYDPDGYLARLKADVPGLSDIVLRYVEEGIGCLRQDFLLASCVMIGCGAEALVLELIESVRTAMQDGNAAKAFAKDTSSLMIKQKHDALLKVLVPIQKTLPRPIGEDMGVFIDQVFNLIRVTRNDAGHPTGRSIPRDVVLANVVIFPSFAKRMKAMISHFATNPI